MSQVNIRHSESATYVGIESTFCTTPSMTRCFPITSGVDLEPVQAELENDEESIYLWDVKDPVKGLKDGKVKVPCYLAPDSTALNAAATPATPWLGTFLKALLGGEQSGAGSTVASSGSGTTVSVASGHGSRFAVGTWGLFEVSGALEPGRISAISTDALTLDLALSAAATSSGLVYNTYCYYPTESNVQTLSVQHALIGNSSHQWTLNGCTGGWDLKLDRNGLLRVDFDLMAATWTGPSSQSLTTTVGSNGMGSPWSMRDAVCILQAYNTTTRTHYPLHSISCKFDSGMEFIPELGGTEGKTGVMRTKGREFVTLTIRFQSDQARDATDWVSRTTLQCVVLVPQGSGTSKRWFILDVPRAIIKGKPKLIKEGGFTLTEITLVSKINTSGTTALARAPFRLAIG